MYLSYVPLYYPLSQHIMQSMDRAHCTFQFASQQLSCYFGVFLQARRTLIKTMVSVFHGIGGGRAKRFFRVKKLVFE